MGWIIGSIVLCLIAFGCFFGVNTFLNLKYKESYNEEKYRDKNNENVVLKKSKVLKFSPLSLMLLFTMFFGTFTILPANTVGVEFNPFAGGIQEETLKTGWNSKSIFSNVIEISTANKSVEITTTGQTKDSIYATFELTIVYKIDTPDAGKFYAVTSATDISASQLNSIVKESLQSATTKADIYSVMGSELESVRVHFEETLSERLYERYFITLISASFNDIDAGSEIESVIKQKAEALQKIEIANAEAEAAKIKAESEAAIKMVELKNQLAMAEESANNEKLLAEIQKEIELVEAEIVKVKADAEAYKVEQEKIALANSITALYQLHNSFDEDGNLVTETVTYQECYDMIISSMFYDKWNGELPQYVSDGSLDLMLPIN